MCSARAIACVSLLAVAASLTVPARAQDQRATIELPAGTIAESLGALARQSGVSVGMAGALPDLAVPAVHGRLTPRQALERMLRDTPFEAVQVGPRSFRLQPRARAAARDAPSPVRARAPIAEGDIVVTAARRAQPLFDAPVAIDMVSGGDAALGPGPATGTRALAARMDGLALTNLGSGRNRVFVRGVADSPFNGYSQSTVSVVLDDSRITFDAPDPDLRLVDVERLELLKGPQGPLYGTGALGGVYRVVTSKPDLSAWSGRIAANGTAGEDVGGGVEAVMNLPLRTDRLAVRASGYAQLAPGWIDNADGRRDSNREHVTGGRVALRWAPAEGWTADVAGTIQLLTVDDSQYVAAGARSFRRPNTVAEPSDNDVRIVSGALSGPVGTARLSLSASVTAHETRSTLDATASAALLGASGAAVFVDDRHYTVADQELRLSSDRFSAFGWVIGLSRLAARTDVTGELAAAGGPKTQIVGLARRVTELAAYASGSLRLAPRWGLDLGLRIASTETEDERREQALAALNASSAERRLTPSAALHWKPSAQAAVYLRYAQGSRAGGLAAASNGATATFRADRLDSVELGMRIHVRPSLQIAGALYRMHWRDMQSDYLLPTGLIGTRNAGDADITGLEMSAGWRIASAWSLDVGATVQSGRLSSPTAGAVATDDPRLPIVPDATLRATLTRNFRLGDWRGALQGRLRAVSASRLSFDAGLDRTQPGYATLAASASLDRGAWHFSLAAENIANSRADTFAFGNAFSIRSQPQRTPIEPRRVSLTATYRWN